MTSAREIIIIGRKYRRWSGAFASCSARAFHLATAGEVIESVLFCCHPLCLKVAQVANRPPFVRSDHCGLRALFNIAERRQIRCTELIQKSAQFVARITEHGEVSPLNHRHEPAAEVLREPL